MLPTFSNITTSISWRTPRTAVSSFLLKCYRLAVFVKYQGLKELLMQLLPEIRQLFVNVTFFAQPTLLSSDGDRADS